jgi:hypothetical protein
VNVVISRFCPALSAAEHMVNHKIHDTPNRTIIPGDASACCSDNSPVVKIAAKMPFRNVIAHPTPWAL